jgi:hypothetical protein
MVSVLVIVYEHSTCSDGATAKLVRQVPHKRIDARHPDSGTSGALQIEAADSCDCFRIRIAAYRRGAIPGPYHHLPQRSAQC